MKIPAAVITAPRPEPTLERSGDSLRAAGFPHFALYRDTGSNTYRRWITALADLVDCHPDADGYAMFHDDVVYCLGVQVWLENALWPHAKAAVCSIFTPGGYQKEEYGWHQIDRG